MFEILCDYVENEVPKLYKKYSANKNKKIIDDPCYDFKYREIFEIYDWWTKDYKVLRNKMWYVAGYVDEEEFFDEKDKDLFSVMSWEDVETEEMLHRLLEVRGWLWS